MCALLQCGGSSGGACWGTWMSLIWGGRVPDHVSPLTPSRCFSGRGTRSKVRPWQWGRLHQWNSWVRGKAWSGCGCEVELLHPRRQWGKLLFVLRGWMVAIKLCLFWCSGCYVFFWGFVDFQRTSGGQSIVERERGPWGRGWCCCVLSHPFRSMEYIRWALPATAATLQRLS